MKKKPPRTKNLRYKMGHMKTGMAGNEHVDDVGPRKSSSEDPKEPDEPFEQQPVSLREEREERRESV